jgi:alkanesulfonate monooxygenase SsuD/methylene tetrahydromethanopterin reductase-like flavin-dependent oxidoreductase (luciferase family)
MTQMPAVAIAATPGKRSAMIELASEVERRGFSGIYCASIGDALSLCHGISMATRAIPFGTAIVNLYARHVNEYAQTAAFLHEVSGGRFRFGIGVSHGPVNERLGVRTGKPLTDVREFVEAWRAVPRVGELPPLVLATLRERMVNLAGEIADGMVYANVARSHMADSLAALPAQAKQRDDFLVMNMIPTTIHDDVDRARERNRKTLTGYAMLPNYRNVWKAAGYVEEMEAIESAIDSGNPEKVPSLLSDRWLADNTLFGPAAAVREGVEAWFDAGVNVPILVPSSAEGNQVKAFEELFATYA